MVMFPPSLGLMNRIAFVYTLMRFVLWRELVLRCKSLKDVFVATQCSVCLRVRAELCWGLYVGLYPSLHTALLWEHLGLDQTPCAVADPLRDPGKLVKSGSLEVAVSQSVGKTDLWRYAKYRQHESRSHSAPFRFLLHEGKQSASF